MKKLMVMALLLVVAIAAYAVHTVDGWGYNDVGGFAIVTESPVTISGDLKIPTALDGRIVVEIGEAAFKDRSNIVSVVIPDRVTSIGKNAFNGCKKLCHIVIPDNVMTIGVAAFQGCEALQSVKLPQSMIGRTLPDNVFNGCVSLGEIIIPNGIVEIGGQAFAGCVSLSNVVVNSELQTIGAAAFGGCTALKTVDIPSSVARVDHRAFSDLSGNQAGCVEEVDGLRYADGWCLGAISKNSESIEIREGTFGIAQYAFDQSEDPYPMQIKLPQSLRRLPPNALPKIEYLKGIEEHQGLLYLGEWCFGPVNSSCVGCVIRQGTIGVAPNAFLRCEMLESISIPDSVKSVESYAFDGCVSLWEVRAFGETPFGPDDVWDPWGGVWGHGLENVEFIGMYAFSNCKSLKCVTLPYTDCMGFCIPKGLFSGCDSLVAVETLPYAQIGSGAFANCMKLESFSLPNSLRFVGNTAFDGCVSYSPNIPFGVEFIGANSFKNVKKVNVLELPKTLKTIGEGAFDAIYEVHYPESLLTMHGSSPLAIVMNGYFDGEPPSGSIDHVQTFYLKKSLEAIWADRVVGKTVVWIDDGKALPAAVTISWEGCDDDLQISLACNTPGSDIFYTIDGCTPNRYCEKYESPLILPGGCEIKAVAWSGTAYGPVVSSTIPIASECTIYFNPNGGNCQTESIRVSKGGKCGDVPVPCRDGYAFAGWFTLTEGGMQLTRSTSVRETRTFYAHWVKLSDPTATLSSLSIVGAESIKSLGRTTYTCSAQYSDGTTVTVLPAWSISSGVDYAEIDGEGILSAESVDSVQSVTISASYAGLTGQMSVRIEPQVLRNNDCLYCVIDLSGGVDAEDYPVTYLNAEPEGGWTDEYKMSKLVLRRIEPGTFTMGRDESLNPLHQVTLTKAFYVGVFEVTQRQWELVIGTRPSYFNNDSWYDLRPVDSVSYEMIRGSLAGAGWPVDNAVDVSSFLGKLRAKTGLDFDLPTEAQWEYACRAGSTTDYNNGTDYSNNGRDSNMDKVGRYGYNSGYYYPDCSIEPNSPPLVGTAYVGSYLPNVWGLYDMHGNVWEWCLDWYGSSNLGAVVDPAGRVEGSVRVYRGGSWDEWPHDCTSSFQGCCEPWHGGKTLGFRLARTLQIPMSPTVITYDENEGTCAVSQQVFERGDKAIGLPLATRDGYVFDGWYTSRDGGMRVNDSTVVEEGVILYAHWVLPPKLLSLSIVGVSSVTSGVTVTYGCKANYSNGTTVLVAPIWSITSGAEYAAIDSSTGELMAKEVSSEQSVILRVRYDSVTQTKIVTIKPLPKPELLSMVISGSDRVTSGSTTTYSCVAYYSDGTSNMVSPIWSISEGALGASIDRATGLLFAKLVSSVQRVGVCASYGGLGVTKSVMIEPQTKQSGEKLYCVIDISGGTDAENYPVSYLDTEPDGGWGDEYKTTKLVLRRIEAGLFKRRNSYWAHLTKPFYIGVFEITQRQWSLVMGASPSCYEGALRPVECVSYDMIRGKVAGANWPNDPGVDVDSFMGRIRARTGLDFDLPTDAQWEYACRAGMSSDYNNGGSSEDDLRQLGRFAANRDDGRGGYFDAHTTVGSYQPNAWGLYDMHGNVQEWCLDWSASQWEYEIDPKGDKSGSCRVVRDGGWNFPSANCTSSGLYGASPNYQHNNTGFRLVENIQSVGQQYVVAFDSCGGDPVPSRQYESGTKMGALPVPVRPEGFKFVGWYTDTWVTTPHGELITEDTIVTGSFTCYAHWLPQYTIRFFANDGTDAKEEQTFVYGDVINLAWNTFTRAGYTFCGWAASMDGVVAYEDGQTVTVGEMPPMQEDWVYCLYAKWAPNNYVIDYNPGQGGAGSMSDQPMTYDEATALYANLFARTGYTFLGWTDDEGELEEVLYYDGVVVSNLTDEVDGEYDLYAVWAANEYMVRFNANGGSGAMADQAFLYDEEQKLCANAFTRTGYSFAGWYVSALRSEDAAGTVADGATVSNLTTEAGGIVTLYAKWSANPYTVRFDANGGEGTMGDLNCTYGTGKTLTACAFARTGYTFAGWAMSAGGAVMYADRASVTDVAASGTVTLYAKWTPNNYVIDFNPGKGGTGTMPAQPMTYDEEVELYANLFARTGYTFLGWTDDPNEVEEVLYCDGVVVENLTDEVDGEFDLYAVWAANEYTVKFNANGGKGVMADQAFVYDAAQKLALNGYTRAGGEFLGWATSAVGEVVYADGGAVSNLTATADGVVTLYAVWNVTGLVDEAETHVDVEKGEVAPFEDAAAVYDGFLYENGKVAGSVQVKVAKMKNGEAKVTATVQMAGQAKKLSFKGGVADATGAVTDITDKDGNKLVVTVGVNGLGGEFRRSRSDAPYRIDGARNVFSGKSAADKTAAGAAARRYQGVYNVAFNGGTLSVSVDKKGKAKIAGTVEGNKVSATSQLVVGKDAAVVPVVITKKVNLSFCLWVMADGTVEARGVEGSIADRPGTLKAGAKFGVDGAAGVRALPGLYGEYLPNGINVAASGTKWVVAGGAKAGKVAFVKDGNTIDESKLGTNPSGLKLAYKEKDGTFKGSFKVYNLENNGKIKSYTANVTGVMIGAKGYGTATIKKPSCLFVITIE